MNRYLHTGLLMAAGMAPALLSACSGRDKLPPDIILILADDLGYGDVSCLNPDGKIPTPNIDALAGEGILFTDAHATSALSTPSRYSILTGRCPWRTTLKTGVLGGYSEALIEDGRPTFATLLSRLGYETACIGKWHLGWHWEKNDDGEVDLSRPISDGPLERGFGSFFGISASLDMAPYIFVEDDRPTETETRVMPKGKGTHLVHGGLAGAHFQLEDCLPELTRRAVQTVSSWKGRQPHLLYLPLTAPHTPCLPSEEFKGKSGLGDYGDFVMMMDDAIGQVVKAVRHNGRYRRTVFIFASDNGCAPYAGTRELEAAGHYPSYIYRGYKSDIFEGGHRIPLILSGRPAVPDSMKGSSCGSLVTLADLYATLKELAKGDLSDVEPGGEDSFSLLPLIRGQETHSYIISVSGKGWFSIRDRRYKLIFTPGSGGWSYPSSKKDCEGLPSLQLYDILSDPGETDNLIHDESLSSRVEEMTRALRDYIQSGSSMPGIKAKNDTDARWEQTVPIFN